MGKEGFKLVMLGLEFAASGGVSGGVIVIVCCIENGPVQFLWW